jgi:hypothetical protein
MTKPKHKKIVQPATICKTLTTGQLVGATWLDQSTVYRYLSEFGDYFSDTAKRPGRGKRWTQQDLQTVQALRSLHHAHQGRDVIIECLKNNWRPPDGSAESSDILYSMLLQVQDQLILMRREFTEHEEQTPLNQRKLMLMGGRLESLELRFYEMETIVNRLDDAIGSKVKK